MAVGGLLAAGVAGVIALATPAPGHAFSLTAGPAAEHVTAGTRHVEQFTVTNGGTRPALVAVSIQAVGKRAGHCGVTGTSAVTGVTVSPASFSLAPGASGVANVSIASTAPAQDLAVVFREAAGRTANGAEVSGEVGSQLVIGGAPECGAAAATGASVPPWWPFPAVALLALGALAVTWRRLRHRPRGAHSLPQGQPVRHRHNGVPQPRPADDSHAADQYGWG